jgi:sugar lactone lactonase YvrE
MLDSMIRVEPGGQVTVLHASQPGAGIGRVNDVSISSSGAMFFTNLNGNTLFSRNPTGTITTRNFNGVNGVEWIEEKNIVYVASGGLQKCTVNPTTGALTNCAAFAGSGSAANTDGLTTDVNGNVWRANWGEGRFYVHDSTGRQLGTITIEAAAPPSGKRFTNGAGGNASNCHFGGPDMKTLYMTGDGGLYSLKVKVAGRRRPQWPTAVGRDVRLAEPRSAARVIWKRNGTLELVTRNGRVTTDGRQASSFGSEAALRR